MPRKNVSGKRRLPIELRLIWLLIRLACRLPVWGLALIGSVLWLLAWPFRRRAEEEAPWIPADAFYRSYRWRSLRTDELEGNRERYGVLTCECCLVTATAGWHVDHIHPRSIRPELALEIANLQVLCEDCNLGKGARYATDWRCQVDG